MQLARRVASTLATNALLALLGLGTSVLAARLLGPTGRGELAAIQLGATILAGLAMLGLAESITYHCARDPRQAATYIASSVLIGGVSALVFIVIGIAIVPIFLSQHTQEVMTAGRIYLLYILLSAMLGLPHHALRGSGHFFAWNVLRLLPPTLWLLILMLMFVMAERDASTLALAYLSAMVLLTIPFGLTVRRRIIGVFRLRAEASSSLIRFGIPSIAATLPQIITSRLDQIVIASSLAPEALGLYVVSVGWAGIAQPLTGAFGAVVLPAIASRSSFQEQKSFFERTARLSALLAGVICLVLVGSTPILLTFLFGESFREAIAAAMVLSIAGAFRSLNSNLYEGFRGLGKPSVVMKAEWIAAAIAVPAIIFLLTQYGLVGAAAATLLTAIATTWVLLQHGRFLLGTSIRSMLVPQIEDIRLVMSRARDTLSSDTNKHR